MTVAIPYIYLGVCSIIGTIYWFKMINILEGHGYKTNGLITLIDFKSFSHLIKNESEPRLKLKYKRIYNMQLAIMPVALVGFILLIGLL